MQFTGRLCQDKLWISAAVLLVSGFLAPAQTPPRAQLHGLLPEAVPHLQPLGRLDGSARLRLSIHLPLHNREGLTNLVEQLYDPASPMYHHYLAAEEFDARFGPTEEDYQAVVDWAGRSGFTVIARHSNRMLLEVSAAVADIEQALQVKMQTYAHPAEARTFFSPDSEPSAEAGVPILSIGGLHDYARPHPANLRRAPLRAAARASPQDVGSGPNGNLAGFDYRAIYAPGVTLTGTGQTVGLMEFDGYYPGDIVAYENQTGVPPVPLQFVPVDGFDGIPTPPGPTSGNSEVALDIEMTMSMAPGLMNLMVFEAGTNGLPNDVLHAMSTNTSVKQFSCSWSFGTLSARDQTNMDDYFLKMETQGQSFFASSGDWGGATNGIGIPAPDDDPYITLVGGTTLATAGGGAPWLAETVWDAGFGPGNANSGGGVSSFYPIPLWQKGVNMQSNGGSTSKRNCPDVAMVADNVFIVADDGQLETTGGTSTATPLWAGFAALANQRAAQAGLASIGFVNPALYHIGTNSGYTACFDDITAGNNTNNSPTHFLAMPGYDLCTGWGSPTGTSLIIALTQPDGFQITPGRGAVANGPAGGPFTVTTQTLTLTNAGKTNFNWSLGAGAGWMNVSSSSGTLTAGGAAASVTLTLNPAANGLAPGVYTNQLWFTNLSSGLAQLRQFTLQVGQELVQDGGFESSDFAYWTLSGDSSIYDINYADYAYDPYGTVNYAPYAGNYFAALGQASNLVYLTQALPTRPNQLYLLSFWLQNPLEDTYNPTNVPGDNPNQFVVRWNTNASTTNVIFNQTNLGPFGWSNFVFTVKAWTNVTTLQFGGRNDNDYLCLDNVSVVPLPAPAVQALAPGDGTFQLAWSALAGANYQVQYLTNVLQTNWLNAGGLITATNNPMIFSQGIVPGAQRYYRVALMP
ncbi:MAG TPA: S53 family peptidase [Candidatus Acidoferrum sp.]|nr:S53 family peptidase [Candidatus Acidoferrum sp.]